MGRKKPLVFENFDISRYAKAVEYRIIAKTPLLMRCVRKECTLDGLSGYFGMFNRRKMNKTYTSKNAQVGISRCISRIFMKETKVWCLIGEAMGG